MQIYKLCMTSLYDSPLNHRPSTRVFHLPSIKRAIRAVRKTRKTRAMRQALDTSKCELDASAMPKDLRDGLIPTGTYPP